MYNGPVIGADLSLNHGALITLGGTVLAYYEDGYGMMSTTDILYARAVMLTNNTPHGSTLVIDFDRDMGHWGTPTVAVMMTMLVSFYGALAQSNRDCNVHYVSPSLVRYCLGLPVTESKADVHAAVKKIYNVEDFPADRHGDQMDAWILALSWACAEKEYSL